MICTLLIALSHLEFLGGGEQANFYDRFLHNPGVAVSFFFMLSGFGLTYRLHAAGKPVLEPGQPLVKSCVGYGIRRIKKVYGLYILTSLLTVPVFIYMGMALKGQSFWDALLRNGLKILLMPSLLQSMTGITSLATLLNGACWFLSALFVLYMVYPLLERWNIRRAGRRNLLCLGLVLALGAGARAFFVYVGQVTPLDYLYYGSPYIRIFEFVAGMLLCDLYVARMEKLRGRVGTAAELCVTGGVLAWFLLGNNLPGCPDTLRSLIEQLLALAVIFVFAFEGGKVSALLNRSLSRLPESTAMYVYLIHYCVRIHISQWAPLLTDSKSLQNVLCVTVIVAVTALWTWLLVRRDRKKR